MMRITLLSVFLAVFLVAGGGAPTVSAQGDERQVRAPIFPTFSGETSVPLDRAAA